MKTRVITALVLLPLLLLIVLAAPKIFTALLFTLIAGFGSYELLSGTGYVKSKIVIGCCLAVAVFISIHSYFQFNSLWIKAVLLIFWCCLFGNTMRTGMRLSFERIAICFIAGALIPYLLTALVRIHKLEYGRICILIPFILAFLSDTGAYFAGRAFGRHKLAPVISPKKTVEGVFGGVIGAIVGMLIFSLVLQFFFAFRVNYLYALIYGFLGSVAAVFGDLCFSVIKRQTGIKDYGKLFPGHGGILDRFDSMVVVAPLVEIMLELLPLAVKI